jgi:hypothetical protein
MITRRNWLLRCSIFANVIVLLYICSHVMIGNNNTNNIGGGGFLIQQLSPTTNQQSTQRSQAQLFQEEQELAAIQHAKEVERQMKLQEVRSVINTHKHSHRLPLHVSLSP